MSHSLSEEQVSDAFHSYLKSSLAQAKAERLLDTELLSSAEADLMITGPALCLYFAALRCTTDPPSVPLPRTSKTAHHIDLSSANCPSAFASFLQVWSRNVYSIQNLVPEYQHDLARIICGLDPVAQPLNPSLNRIAAELRAVAIEISQRRTFQDRYAADLQAAIDAGEDGHVSTRNGRHRRRVMASFVPPPMYDPSPSHSPQSSISELPPSPPPHDQQFLSPVSPNRSWSPNPSRPGSRAASPASSVSSRASTSSFAVDAPAIQLIRETLYASLADVFTSHKYLRRLLQRDPPRAYFASVSLAILDVATNRTSLGAHNDFSNASTWSFRTSSPRTFGMSETDEEVVVTGILGARLTLQQCPPELRPFMHELGSIGQAVKQTEEEDSIRAVEILSQSGDGEIILPEPRLDRVRRILEHGVGAENKRSRDSSSQQEQEDERAGGRDGESGRLSLEGRAVALANRINALALGMTKLRAFRERQNEVFKVLASVVS